MKHLIRRFLSSVVFLVCTVHAGHAFSLLGPFIPWQTAQYAGFNLGYNQPGDIGGPMTPLEAYRWNTPVLTYAFDETFIRYFGLEGMREIEEMFGILNALPEASRITNDSSGLYINGERVPTDTKRVNYQARAVGLLDIKSFGLFAIMEQLGLAAPERWVYTLRGRAVLANNTITNWSTIVMNYDPITLGPTNRVNAVFYTYEIVEVENPNVAEALEINEDPLALFPGSSVASGFLTSGEFYTGLTHDDVGGLRFLLDPDNVVTEVLLPNVQVSSTAGRGVRGSPWIPYIGTNTTSTNVVVPPTTTNTATFGLITNALRGGVNKIQFQRVNFDSLLGQTFTTITNRYSDNLIARGRIFAQPVQRVITQPDIVFAVGDLGVTLAGTPFIFRRSDTSGWINSDALNGTVNPPAPDVLQGGPGTITPRVVLTFTDKLPYFNNSDGGLFVGSGFVNSLFVGDPTGSIGGPPTRETAFRSLIWGSYDGTTNTPVIYPRFRDLNLEDLQNELDNTVPVSNP